MEQNRKKLTSNIFSMIVVLIPLLNNYSIQFLPGSLSDWAAFILVGIVLFQYICVPILNLDKIEIVVLAYFGVVYLNFIVYIFTAEKINDVLLDYFRQFLFLLIVIFGIKKCGDLNIGRKILRLTTLLSCLYCWMQYIFIHAFRIVLPSYLPFFQHRSDLDLEFEYAFYPQYYRPHSIFSEPSIFCEYILICLMTETFFSLYDKRTENNILIKFFITITCFITGSTTGIVGAVFIWILYAFAKGYYKLKVEKGVLFLIPFILIGFYFIVGSNSFWIFIQRFFVDKSSLSGRFDNINFLWNRGLRDILMGQGYTSEKTAQDIGWIPGYALVYIYYGLIGIIVLLSIIIIIYICLKKGNKLGRAMLMLFVIMNMGSYPLFSAFLLIDMFFIIKSFDLYKENNQLMDSPSIQFSNCQ